MYEFSRKFRLLSKQDFRSLFIQSRKLSHHALLVLHKSNQKAHARLGIIVAKQHVRLAVHRNLVRRLVRDSFRYHKEALKGLDILVVFRSKYRHFDKNTLRDNIETLWSKLSTSE